MYTEAEWLAVREQVRKRRVIIIAASLLMLAVSVSGLIMRNQIVCTAALLAGACGFVFFYDLTVHPLACYARMLEGLVHGKTHEDTVLYDRIEEQSSMVDGVNCHVVHGSVSDDAGHRYDHTYYLDAEKPTPAWRSGERITFICHENVIADWREADT